MGNLREGRSSEKRAGKEGREKEEREKKWVGKRRGERSVAGEGGERVERGWGEFI